MTTIKIEYYDPRTRMRYTRSFDGPEAQMRAEMFVQKLRREKKQIRDYRRIHPQDKSHAPMKRADSGRISPDSTAVSSGSDWSSTLFFADSATDDSSSADPGSNYDGKGGDFSGGGASGGWE